MRQGKPTMHSKKSLFVKENSQGGIFAARKTTFFISFVLKRTMNEA
jgi:hypothetical protein